MKLDSDKVMRLMDAADKLSTRFDAMCARGDADSAAKIDDALLGLRAAIKSLTSCTEGEIANETRLCKSALKGVLSLDISRTNNRFGSRADLIMQANALMARRIAK